VGCVFVAANNAQHSLPLVAGETSPNKVDAYQNNEVGKSGEDTQ